MAEETSNKNKQTKTGTSGTGKTGRKSSSAKKTSNVRKNSGADKASKTEKASGKKRTKKQPEKELAFTGMRSRRDSAESAGDRYPADSAVYKKVDSGSGKRKKTKKAIMLRLKRFRILMMIVWGMALFLIFLSRVSGDFSEWYASHIYPLLVGSLGRIFSLFPVSIVEIGLYAGILWIIWRIVTAIRQVLQKKRHLKEVGISGIYVTALLCGCLLLVFTLLGGINYQRRTFVETAGLSVNASEREELVAFLELAAGEINAAAAEMQTDEEGRSQVSEDLRKLAVSSMGLLGDEFESLGGYYPNPKPILISDILSYQKVTGVYSPFTAEANYNPAIPDYELPHTLCHELAHLKGFMREEEANFISWLACTRSQTPEFRYSGWLVAFVYAGNDLGRYDSSAYMEIRSTLCETAINDLGYGSQFWKQFDGPVAETHNKVNDIYLKANSQSDGVESYGRVVELMLAYIRNKDS